MRLKLWTLVAALATLCFVGCSYDDTDINNRVDDLENRVTTLEQLCQQMNTNITSLQTIVNALQQQDYITSVTPIQEGGSVIGYTINFAKNDPITIYHGKDGANGANGADGADGANGKDGKDGYVPQIGVAKDETDGLYYWTLDGEWLTDAEGNKVRAQGLDGSAGNGGADGEDGKDGQDGEDGKDGQDGEDGKDGQDGKDGEDGKDGKDGQDGKDGEDGKDGQDGITPLLKIKLNFWYISYDNGVTWERLGPATGDDGDSFFKSVDVEGDYVVIVLNDKDNTTISIPTQAAFEALEERVAQLESNVESIQTLLSALENRHYIDSWGELKERNEVVGYWIKFVDVYGKEIKTIKIYHGKDGKDGHTPIIGTTYIDGAYYWTVDGKVVKDKNNNPIPTTGPKGENGLTPEFKIDNDHLLVTFNGTEWVDLGNVKGDKGETGAQGPQGNTGATGPQGPQGEKGDSFFKSVTEKNGYVEIVLVDGSTYYIPTKRTFDLLKKDVERLGAELGNLQFLVKLIRENKVIGGYERFTENGRTGWAITFVNLDGSGRQTIKIYDGQDGQDGHSPAIGVTNIDGVYYWTIDGKTVKDESGNPIPVTGPKGDQGDQGDQGEPGEPGATPEFKIDDNGRLKVSFDGGNTWTDLGNVIGPQGPTGATGSQGPQGNTGATGPQGPAGSNATCACPEISISTDNNGNVVISIGDNDITVPQYKGLAIGFVYGGDDVKNGAISVYENQIGEQITINFDVTYCGDDTHRHSNLAVEAFADDWDVEAALSNSGDNCGTITVKIDDEAEIDETEKVVVFISDGNGNTTMATLKITIIENPVPPLKVGDIYNDASGKALGVIYYIDDEEIKIVGLKDITNNNYWGDTTSMDWNTANSAINNLDGDWEFPTVDDWDDIYTQKNAINNAISGNSNDISGTYWAEDSYQYGRHKIYNTDNGKDSNQQYNSYKARAVKTITLE